MDAPSIHGPSPDATWQTRATPARTTCPRHRARLATALVVAGSLLLAGSVGVAGQTPSGAPGGGPGAPGAGGAPPGGGGSGSTGLASTASGAYRQSGGTASKSGQTFTAANADESGVLVTDGGTLTLIDATVTTSGDTSSDENSSFYGLNAGVLATGGSSITMQGGTISTTGTGANGAFASGTGSSVDLSDVTISATGDGGHGVMATQGGSVSLTNVTMDTAGTHAAPLATDRGGGTVVATGGTYVSSGADSPGIYSTGAITVTGGTYTSTGSESAVIEGANSITLTDSTLTSSKADKWGVMIYQSMSGDATGTRGTFTMTGGSLSNTATTGPLFYVTNSTGVITLSGVDVSAGSGILVDAATGNWGTSGSNGGTVLLIADAEMLMGDLVADDISSIAATLQNRTTLTGAIDSAGLTLDATSTWVVTADSTLTSLTDPSGVSGTSVSNITGNGHTVTYDASLAANSWLDGGTYTLAGGGTLTPAGG
jgi:hypothetical protein